MRVTRHRYQLRQAHVELRIRQRTEVGLKVVYCLLKLVRERLEKKFGSRFGNCVATKLRSCVRLSIEEDCAFRRSAVKAQRSRHRRIPSISTEQEQQQDARRTGLFS